MSLKLEYPWGRIAVNHKRLEYSFDFTQSYLPYFSVTCSNILKVHAKYIYAMRDTHQQEKQIELTFNDQEHQLTNVGGHA